MNTHVLSNHSIKAGLLNVYLGSAAL